MNRIYSRKKSIDHMIYLLVLLTLFAIVIANIISLTHNHDCLIASCEAYRMDLELRDIFQIAIVAIIVNFIIVIASIVYSNKIHFIIKLSLVKEGVRKDE